MLSPVMYIRTARFPLDNQLSSLHSTVATLTKAPPGWPGSGRNCSGRLGQAGPQLPIPMACPPGKRRRGGGRTRGQAEVSVKKGYVGTVLISVCMHSTRYSGYSIISI
jgi:hypothetical protein